MAQVKIKAGILEMEVSGPVAAITNEVDAFSTYLRSENGIKAMAAFRGDVEALETVAPVPAQGLLLKAWKRRDEVLTLAGLKDAIQSGRGPTVIHPFDEVDIPLDTGGFVTAVCGYVDDRMARFVFKDCYDEHVMNEEATNKTGYHGSEGRRHVLEGILPHLPPELRSMIVPRKLTEIIGGEKVEYADPLWLPSATDVFGNMEGKWWPDEPDSFQLPIFQRERDRVKECGESGTYLWWLRSVNATDTAGFCNVGTGGTANNNSAYYSYGFAPGFDL